MIVQARSVAFFGVDYTAYSVSWLGNWNESWGPYPVDDGKLVPAGHWKHLFRLAYGVTAPETRAKATTRARVVPPTTTHVIRIPADTPDVRGIVRTRAAVAEPYFGVQGGAVRGRVRTRARVKRPVCGGTAPFLRGYGWAAVGKVAPPACGCAAPARAGMAYGRGYPEAPVTVRNPTMQELMAIM